MKIKAWISAARPRTLPLSLASILFAGAVAFREDIFSSRIFSSAILTTILLQVLSNFANDYGDFVKGTDNENRVGPKRATQSGAINKNEMKIAIIIYSVLSFLSGIYLLFAAFGNALEIQFLVFLILGIMAIAAAIKYTVGNNAYGYAGLGDLFVFLFFGIIGVCGTYFLFGKVLNAEIFFPAISIGLLSVAVLNLNNMRDIENDRTSMKNTIPVRIGISNAKKYHFFLLLSAMILLLCYGFLAELNGIEWSFLITFLPIIAHIRFVYNNDEPVKFDPELKKVAMSTFLISLLFFISTTL